MPTLRHCCLAVFALLCFFRVSAQEIMHRDSVVKRPKKVRVLPLPIFGSSPETRFYFGAVGLFTLDFYQDSVTRVSTAELEFNYTLNKQMIIEADWFYNTRHNDFILIGDNNLLKFPELYWGVGNRTTDSDEELYQAWRLELTDVVLRRAYKDLYGGLLYRLQYMFAVESDPAKGLSTGNVLGNAGGVSSGIGYALLWDKRDNILNPGGGSSYLSFQNVFYHRNLGSDYNFSSIELDGRLYFKTWPTHILAFQTFNQFNFGPTPFRMLAMLGSGSHSRGYYRGRYRDQHYLSVQTEYRMPIWRWIGIAAFAGLGDVSADFGDLDGSRLKYSLGGALRIRVIKDQNAWLRADYAVGLRSTGFYLSFGEVF